MRIYFVRHGESEANVIREISNRGWRHGLTEKGRRQAADLAVHLRDRGVVKVYTSPLMRAVQTAQILAEVLTLPNETTDALREYDCGIIEGQSGQAAWDQWTWLREEWFERGNLDAKIEGGESFEEIRQRFVPFVEDLARAHAQTDSSLVLIGHGGLYTCMLPLVLHNVPRDLALSSEFPNTSYVLAESGSGGLVCASWCGMKVGR